MGTKYLGKRKASELAGAAVRLTRACSNGLGSMPAGTRGTITNAASNVREGFLSFKSDACTCCGFRWHVSGLYYADLELVEEVPESTGGEGVAQCVE